MTEAQLQSIVIELAMLRRWRIHHSRPAIRQSGKWSTPITGHKGLPDLILLRPPRLLFVELKTEKGSLSPGQIQWAAGLQAVEGIESYVWRPSDWIEGRVDSLLS